MSRVQYNETQLQYRKIFGNAARYASSVLKDPEKKAGYLRKGLSGDMVYHAALKDYMKLYSVKKPAEGAKKNFKSHSRPGPPAACAVENNPTGALRCRRNQVRPCGHRPLRKKGIVRIIGSRESIIGSIGSTVYCSPTEIVAFVFPLTPFHLRPDNSSIPFPYLPVRFCANWILGCFFFIHINADTRNFVYTHISIFHGRTT